MSGAIARVHKTAFYIIAYDTSQAETKQLALTGYNYPYNYLENNDISNYAVPMAYSKKRLLRRPD